MFSKERAFVYITIDPHGRKSVYATDTEWTESQYEFFRKEKRVILEGIKTPMQSLDDAVASIFEKPRIRPIITQFNDPAHENHIPEDPNYLNE